MDVESLPSVERLGALGAQVVAELAMAKPTAVFGWPSGRTTLPILEALGEHEDLDLSRATVMMMDDYAIPSDSGYVNGDADSHFSCRHWIKDSWEKVLPPERLPRFMIPDPKDPEHYEASIAQLGGIDVFFAGIGASDGHVAFNPPGTPADSRTRVIALAESTRRDNLHTFPEFASLEEVPTHGVTVGLGTVLSARQVIAVAHGAHKRDVVERTLAYGGFNYELPSTCLYLKDNCKLLIAELGA